MSDAHEVHVRQERVPGLGQLFQLAAPDGSAITVVAEDSTGRRELLVRAPGADEPSARVELPEAHAVTLATLLSGVRVVFESEPEVDPADGVHVETFVIGAGSPAVGRMVHEIQIPAPDHARILAVIRDDTPALVEDDAERPCEPGDRLVLAGRPAPLAELRSFLAGR